MMDSSKVYIDSLIMPRAIAIVKDGILLCEDQKLWFAPDLNKDLRADNKQLVDPDYAGPALPEHSGNGLWRGVDNWYYNAKSRFRYKWIDNQWVRDSTEFRGQWGLSHDNQGRLYYNYNWSQLHADLVPPNYLSRNRNHQPTSGIDHGVTLDRRIYPIRPTPAVNRGYIPGTLDDDGKLLEFTAACSPFFYRETLLPVGYVGSVFVCEPSGNLIKQNVVSKSGLVVSAHDPHPGDEFLASTDERFRPVHITTGPDGGLYVADMYRGVIQHAAYVTPYLRDQSLKRKLEQPVHYGRIWRVVPKGWKPTTIKTPGAADLQELTMMLNHPNGWYRDVAQRLIVQSGDRSLQSTLQQIVKSSTSNGRFHALWTLDGLGSNNQADLVKLIADDDLLIGNTALRLLDQHKPEGHFRTTLQDVMTAPAYTADITRALQAALSSTMLPPRAADEVLINVLNKHIDSPVIRDAIMSGLQDREFDFLRKIIATSDWKTQSPSREIFTENLAVAITRKGNVDELNSLFAMLDVTLKLNWWQAALLSGMTLPGNPIVLSTPPGIWSKAILGNNEKDAIGRKFEWPGHKVDTLSAGPSKLDERQQELFALGRQHYLSTCSGCHGNNGAGMQRFAPTLIGSDWVTGDERRLALLLLHGIEGPIEVAGKVYDAPEILPVMPAHSTLDDQVISAIMVYIRNEWGNNAGPVNGRTVGRIRHRTQGRIMPWTARELNDHMQHVNEWEEE
jgi:mono/diheme cytochrome c family protein